MPPFSLQLKMFNEEPVKPNLDEIFDNLDTKVETIVYFNLDGRRLQLGDEVWSGSYTDLRKAVVTNDDSILGTYCIVLYIEYTTY